MLKNKNKERADVRNIIFVTYISTEQCSGASKVPPGKYPAVNFSLDKQNPLNSKTLGVDSDSHQLQEQFYFNPWAVQMNPVVQSTTWLKHAIYGRGNINSLSRRKKNSQSLTNT